jgi:hypothetical protein
MMAAAQSPVIHLILRNHFDEESVTHFAYRVTDLDTVQGVPVLAFRDRERAEAYREGLEDAERRKADPFTYGNRYDDLPGPREYATIARAAGLDPPLVFDPERGEHLAWVEWWRRVVDDLPFERVRALWHQFQGEYFFAITAVALEGDLPRDARAVFVVRQISWGQRQDEPLWYPARDHTGRLVFGRPEGAFADRPEAEAFRARAERQARIGRNPFAHTNGGADPVADRTGFGYPLLRDWLLDCGAGHVPDPDATAADWREWWDRAIPVLSPLQQAKAWEAFDRICLFDVVEVEMDD